MLNEIVKQALARPICNIGQLAPAEKRQLNAAVKRGVLSCTCGKVCRNESGYRRHRHYCPKRMERYCSRCDAAITEADHAAGRCTNCGEKL